MASPILGNIFLSSSFILTCFMSQSSIKSICQTPHNLTLASLLFSDWMIFSMRAYSAKTPKTWMMQETTQVSTAVRPSAFGALAVTELKMLTRTRNKVTRSAILPER